jgi:hypothetical protein
LVSPPRPVATVAAALALVYRQEIDLVALRRAL